jgi:tyrosine ammonia-lyase
MTLALFGEGQVLLKGDRMSATDAFRITRLSPLTPSDREALAFVNGTSAMTAVAALNAIDAQRALELALRSTVLYAELLGGRSEAYHAHFAAVRPHAGQQWATRELHRLCAGSRRLQPYAPKFLPAETIGINELPQDPYTIRCAPQIFGAIADVLRFHNDIVETELNSVTDNPIFFDDDVLHGGNFYGQHVAFASDALMTAIVKLAVHSERKIARITDETQNRGLPAFLQGNRTGLHSGFMGAQVTASAIVAEMRIKAVPASIQSIPTNGNNQDVVTMGTIAARRTAELIDYLFDLLAIDAMVMVQAFEIRGGFESDEFAPSSKQLASQIRSISPFVKEDRPLHADIARVSQELRTGRLPSNNQTL